MAEEARTLPKPMGGEPRPHRGDPYGGQSIVSRRSLRLRHTAARACSPNQRCNGVVVSIPGSSAALE
eukprot:9171303-Alexandrium_andersonii.AAC.1